MQIQENRIFPSGTFSSHHRYLETKSHSIRRYAFLPGLFLCLGRRAKVLRIGKRKWCFVNVRSARDFHIRYQLAKRKEAKGQDLNEVMQRLYQEMRNAQHKKVGLYSYLRGSYQFRKGRFFENMEKAPLAMTDRYRGNFYKLQKEGKTIGYLLGTMHAGKKNLCPLPYKMTRSLFKSSTIYFEVVFSKLEQKKAKNGRERALKKAATRPRARKAAEQRMRLFRLYGSAFFMVIFGLITGLRLKYGIERSIKRIVEKYDPKNNSFKGLETVDDRIHVFEKIADHLEEIVADETSRKGQQDGIKETTKSVFDAFQKGSEKEIFSREDQFMLIDRNHGMVKAGMKAIEELPKGQRAFMAVGANHLAGPEGMHELFRKEGLTVIRR